MRWVFAALLILIGAVVLGLLAREDPGYVMVQFHGWTVEASLLAATAALLLGFFFLYLVIRLFGGARRLSPRFRDWVHRRRERRAIRALSRGFIDLLQGNWRRAEKRLTAYAAVEDAAVLAYLGAARAAQGQGADERRDEYLRRAAEAMPEAETALALMHAEMQIQHGQHQQARATLDRLQALAPKNGPLLERLLRLYVELQDWNAVVSLVPLVRRRITLDPGRLGRLERKAYLGLLGDTELRDEADITALWRRTPAALKTDEEVVRCYIARLIDCGAGDRAEEALSIALGKQWSPSLVTLYGLLQTGDAARQLRRAEGWLASHEDDPQLLLALGRLSRRNSLWGKARHYLEACVRIGGPPEAMSELALILETMGEREEALNYYRRAAARPNRKTPDRAAARRSLSA